MRILLSNPDTIGDLVLRQPMCAALQAAGHELMLLVRPLTARFAAAVAPGARTFVVDGHLYDRAIRAGNPLFAPAVEAARAFAPDVFVVASFQWTQLEETLWGELCEPPRGGARGVAMSGVLYGGGPSRIASSATVRVQEPTRELEKNALLAGVVLGRGAAAELPAPRIEASAAQIEAARAVLARLGVEPGSYWSGCIGHSQHTAVRNWSEESWASLLAAWLKRRPNRRFVAIGSAEELETTRRIAALSRCEGLVHAHCATSDGSLDELVGLLALSRGYLGRDTGPMHLAAALGRAVVALFGGGTWPRFVPAARLGAAVTVRVPCAPCDWRCHLSASLCVKSVPVAELLSELERADSAPTSGFSVVELDPGVELLTRIARESSAAVRAAATGSADVRSIAAENLELRGRNEDLERRLAALTNDAQRLAAALAAREPGR